MMEHVANSADSRSEAIRVAGRIRTDILDGIRLPGSKLVERDLAEELGVSRVPVREALKTLVAEGLVTLRPRTWAIVREFSPSDIADFNEVREVFETLAFRLAAQRRSAEGLARLRAALDSELDAARAGDAVTARRAAADFHEVVTELSANHLVQEIGQLTRSRMRWLLSQHGDLLEIANQHAELYEAIARRDVSAVEELSRAHLRTSEQQRRAREASDAVGEGGG